MSTNKRMNNNATGILSSKDGSDTSTRQQVITESSLEDSRTTTTNEDKSDGKGGASSSLSKRPRLANDDDDDDDRRGDGSTTTSLSGNDSPNNNNGNNINSNNNNRPSTKSVAMHHRSIRHLEGLDSKKLRDLMCGNCIFCRMPCCERCVNCVTNNNVPGRREEEKGCCLRKMCCNVPTELKLQSMDGLGFPRGWRYTFDDPQKTSLVWKCTDRILSLAGLKIVSPEGRIFHSFESAFAHIVNVITIPQQQHSSSSSSNYNNDENNVNIEDFADMVERFLALVGSSRHASVPDHFLIGKSYCIEFTREGTNNGTSTSISNTSNNIVLYGKIMACMGPSSAMDNNDDNQNDDDDDDDDDDDNDGNDEKKLFFIVQYDSDMLSIAKSMGTNVQPVQLIKSEVAWGGCISYERKIHCRRDSQSAIRNIDQATAAETWIAPDMRLEEMVEGSDGTSLPRLTLVARGYKFVFRVRASSDHGGKQSFGVFASCTSMPRNADQVINLKPGELIDLGFFSLLGKEDKKSLPAFIVKNYIHHLRVGRWGVVSGEDNVVYDLTDDKTGMLHDGASKKVLSYVRKRSKSEMPTIHARLDPSGCVHFLFGIQYEGNWEQYERGVQELVPLFCGMEVEMTIDRQHGLGKKSVAGSKYIQSIGLFQLQDIIACRDYLDQLFDSNNVLDQIPSTLIDRSKEVVKCLEGRTQKLLKMFEESKSHKEGLDVSSLKSTLERMRELARMLDGINM